MPHHEDIFDLLDISLREDSYTRLIKAAIELSPEITRAFFREMSRREPQGPIEVRFRQEFPFKTELAAKDDRPDLLLIADDETGSPFWVLIESKIASGEGFEQLKRYHSVAKRAMDSGKIIGYGLHFLTLLPQSKLEPGWRSITHFALCQRLCALLPSESELPQALRIAWTAYRKRAEEALTPGDEQPIAEWLTPQGGFVTIGALLNRLARSIAPAGWLGAGFPLANKGKEQWLLQFTRSDWSSPHVLGGTEPPHRCINLHCELELPVPCSRELEARLHLHLETNPYAPWEQIRGKFGTEALNQYAHARDAFRNGLENKLPTGWKIRRGHVQIACARLAFSPQTTVAQLRTRVHERIEALPALLTTPFSELLFGACY